jgi:hypothetical protein
VPDSAWLISMSDDSRRISRVAPLGLATISSWITDMDDEIVARLPPPHNHEGHEGADEDHEDKSIIQ